MQFRISSLLVVVFLVIHPSFSQGVELQFENEDQVGLCCFGPGTEALFFGVVWMERPWLGRISVHRAVIPVSPGGDTAWYGPDIGVPLQSYWIGVDLSTGEFCSESRMRRGLEIRTIPPEALARDTESTIIGFDLEAGYLEAIVVRPGQGAWAFTGGDGSTFDGDGSANLSIRSEIDDYRSIEDGPPLPVALEKGDLILALDTWRGILFTTTIDG